MSMTRRNSEGKGAKPQASRVQPGAITPAVILTAEAGFAALIGVLAASMMWAALFGSYMTPLPAPANMAAAQASSLPPRIVSGSPSQLFSGRAGAPQATIEVLPETRLGFALFGVRTGMSADQGSAIIEVGAGGQRSYLTGSSIQDGITLDAVYPDRVVINRRGSREVLYLTERARARSQAPAEPLQSVTLAGVTLTPHPLQAGGEGLRLDAVPATLAALGLQGGDVIASVDGEPLTPARVAALSASLSDGTLPSSLSLERGGERLLLQTRVNP